MKQLVAEDLWMKMHMSVNEMQLLLVILWKFPQRVHLSRTEKAVQKRAQKWQKMVDQKHLMRKVVVCAAYAINQVITGKHAAEIQTICYRDAPSFVEAKQLVTRHMPEEYMF